MPGPFEIEGWFQRIDAMPDKECALAFGAMLEAVLEVAIGLNLSVLREKQFNEIFRDQHAPLNTLSARIIFSQSLGIVGEEMGNQLALIRSIRNAFAHAVMPVDFNDPTISAEAARLDVNKLRRPEFTMEGFKKDARGRFSEAVTTIFAHLMEYIEDTRADISAARRTLPTPFRSKFC
jgi:hypothetical protein